MSRLAPITIHQRRLRTALVLSLCFMVALMGRPALARPLSLPDLIRSAQTQHPSVLSQTALTAAADAGLEAARWQYYPTPGFSVQRSTTGQNDPLTAGSRVITTASLTQPLWTWGRLDAGVSKAQAQQRVAQAARNESLQQIALRVIQTYGEWMSAHQKRQAYSATLEVQQRLTVQVRRRVEEGQAAPSDLALVDGRQAGLRADWRHADMQARTGLARLAVLVGQTVHEADLTAQFATAWPVEADLPQLLQLAQDWAPSVARLQGQLEVLEASLQEQQARLKPELQARFEVHSGNSAADINKPLPRAYIGFTSQFGAGLSNLSAISEAGARIAAAQADLQAQRLALVEQVSADLDQISSASTRKADLLQSLRSAQGVIDSWGRQYLAGRKTWQDLMNAVREEVQLQAQMADFDAAQLIASWRLALLTGQNPAHPAARTP